MFVKNDKGDWLYKVWAQIDNAFVVKLFQDLHDELMAIKGWNRDLISNVQQC
jgi:hypothetical protein